MNRIARHASVGLLSLLMLGAAPASQPSSESRYERQLRLVEQERDRAEVVREKARSEVAQMRDELRKLGRADISPDGIRKAITRLQEQQEEQELEQAGAEGRRKGLTEAIERMTAQVQKKAESDNAAAELNQVVALREQELKRMQELAKQGAVSPQQLTEAQVAVADARVKLMEVRRQAVGTANSETLDTWNRELMNLTIAQQEREARLIFIQSRLNLLSSALPRLDEMERRLAEEHAAETAFRQAEWQLNQVRARLELGTDLPQNAGPSTP